MSATEKPPPVDPAEAGQSNVPRILGLAITFHTLALVFVALRMYTRIVIVKSFGKDDAMMLACVVGLLGGGLVTICVAVAHGLGHHAFTLSAQDEIIYGQTVFAQALITTIASLCFLKISIGLSLLRLSGNDNVWYRRTIWALIIFICLYMVESWISIIFFCFPIAAQWDKSLLPTAKCWPLAIWSVFPIFNTACNMFTDIAFATLPIPLIWRLQMKRRTRIYLVVIFSLGYIAVGIGIAKAISQVMNRGDPDAIFNNWTQTWGFLQQNVGVIAACAPTLRPLVGRVLKLGSTQQSNDRYYGGYPKKSAPYSLPQKGAGMGYIRDHGDGSFEMQAAHADSKTSINGKSYRVDHTGRPHTVFEHADDDVESQ